MAEVVLAAETGRELGTRSSRRLRREAKVPGVVYGLESEPTSFAVDYGELRRALTTEAGLNALIQLEIDGERQLSILESTYGDARFEAGLSGERATVAEELARWKASAGGRRP